MNLSADGFLGTNASLLSDLSLVLGVLVALTLTVGMLMAVRKRYEIHRWIQTSAVVLNVVQIELIMSRQFRRNASPGIPDRLNEGYYLIAAIHAGLGLLTVLFGLYVMLTGQKVIPKRFRFTNYKPFMRTAYGLYMLLTLVGLSVYYRWYVIGGGPTAVAEGAPQPVAQGENELGVPIANFAFNPPDVEIPVGTTLIWQNQDGAPHTATAEGGLFGSEVLSNGDNFSFTFQDEGEFPYYCELHGSAGGFGMAAVIRVVPVDQAPTELVAAVPEQIQPTPQPTPHPLPDTYFDQPPGTAAFRDNLARSDQLLINVALAQPLPDGTSLYAFLLPPAGAEVLSLGELTASGSEAHLDYISPSGENLAGRYNHLLISQEPSGSQPAAPSGPVAFESVLPPQAFTYVTQLLADGPGLSGAADYSSYGSASGTSQKGYLTGIRLQTDELMRHVEHISYNQETGNVDGIRRHAEHAYNILSGLQDPQFGDLNGDGSSQNPGDGIGLLPNGVQPGYLQLTAEAAQAAIDAPDATEAIKAHAGHVLVVTENMTGWAEEARALSLELSQAPDAASVAGQVEQLDALASWLLLGNDADGDGAIAPVPGEGGGIVGYEHAQFMAGFGLSASGVAPVTY